MENRVGDRLVSARKMAGLSLQELADKLEKKISKQALNKYEKGILKPNSSLLIEISNKLNVPVDYFFRKQNVKLEEIKFRKKCNLKAKEIEKIKEETSDFLERYLELEQLMNIKSTFINPLKNNNSNDVHEINKLADELRNIWKLGIDPLPEITEMFEENNIKIFEVSKEESFDGMSTKVNGIPVIVINKNIKLLRKRFTLSHELAHLIFDLKEIDEKENERICNTFAGAFLIPEESFKKEFGERRGHLDLKELTIIGDYYGISVQAIMARARFLNLITDYTYKNFNIWLSKTNNRKIEFGDYKGKEEPVRFYKLLYRGVSEGIITISKAAVLAGIKLSEFEKKFEPVV